VPADTIRSSGAPTLSELPSSHWASWLNAASGVIVTVPEPSASFVPATLLVETFAREYSTTEMFRHAPLGPLATWIVPEPDPVTGTEKIATSW